MGVFIEDVSIISVCTIGSHTHYEYIYNGYIQIGPCTCPLRINIAGSPVDRHRSKKA